MVKLSQWLTLALIFSACGKKVDETKKKTIHTNVIDLETVSSVDTQLLNAIKDKEALLVKQALILGADPNQYDDNSFRPMAYAIQARSIEIIELLLSYGAKTTELDIRSNSALHLAIMLKQESILYYLLRQKPTLEQRNAEGKTPLEYAVSENYPEGVKILLAYNNIFKKMSLDYDYLQSLGSRFQADQITELLAFNKKLSLGHNVQQLFFEALDKKFLEGIELIASANNIKSIAKGQNVLSSVIKKCGNEFTEQDKTFITGLMALGLNVNGEKADNALPLINAVQKGNYEAVTYLLSLGAKINKVSSEGETALFVAVQKADTEMVKLLSTLGAFSTYFYRENDRLYKVNICKFLPEYRRGLFRTNDYALKEKVEKMKEYLTCE